MTERNKVVIRHLPPALPEEVFWKTLSPWIDPINESTPAKCLVTYKSFIPGKLRQNKGKIDLPSRAYLYFSSVEDLVEFHHGYAQQAFRDSRGNITVPKIEFAPFQKIPTQVKKLDPRCGTIDSSQDYQLFLKKLESPLNQETEDDSNQSNLTEDSTKLEIPKITPLIQHLRSLRKSAQEATTAQKLQQRNTTTTSASKVSSIKDPHDLPPHQLIKRAPTSSNHQSLPLTTKPSKSRPVPSSFKPSKGNPTTSNVPKSTGTSSVPKPSVIDPVEPKPQTAPSKPKRGKRAIDQASQSKPITDPSGSNNPKPIPMKIVSRPKEILLKPSGSGSVPVSTESFKTSKVGNQEVNLHQPNPNLSQEGKPSSKKPYPKGSSSTSRPNPSKRNQPSTPTLGTSTPPTETRSTNETKSAATSTTNPRARGTEESAGARRRLGMALAGIGGTNERKSSRKDTPKNVPNP
ncbi:uncharacterized protein MELLADRAFT_78386 [Melampsora larici-populina 98AG31]|uniref:UPF3 domain-containing protein n=1 Tax=Melampsora larici-populina (strain 98AG31 / pathotype 3-4-7) TaxID=747676 RepID=F4RTQ9_MELLP|nr:uncharacterized protein MELLADRAFT_78386 [Melampsora larici-populina 98AG31]EGG04220.1 hypothetical protein MELLADRAFT_78386 [Melampsora larici-populina 98AG31]